MRGGRASVSAPASPRPGCMRNAPSCPRPPSPQAQPARPARCRACSRGRKAWPLRHHDSQPPAPPATHDDSRGDDKGHGNLRGSEEGARGCGWLPPPLAAASHARIRTRCGRGATASTGRAPKKAKLRCSVSRCAPHTDAMAAGGCCTAGAAAEGGRGGGWGAGAARREEMRGEVWRNKWRGGGARPRHAGGTGVVRGGASLPALTPVGGAAWPAPHPLQPVGSTPVVVQHEQRYRRCSTHKSRVPARERGRAVAPRPGESKGRRWRCAHRHRSVALLSARTMAGPSLGLARLSALPRAPSLSTARTPRAGGAAAPLPESPAPAPGRDR